jgi:hypothetical protein
MLAAAFDIEPEPVLPCNLYPELVFVFHLQPELELKAKLM